MKKFLTNIMLAGILVSAPLIYPSYVNSPETLSLWFQSEFTYEHEEKNDDYWKKPAKTISDKAGDCEDFAFLADKILSELDYNTKVICLFYKNDDTAHAICLIKIQNKYTFMSNFKYYNQEHETIEDLLTENYPNWKAYETIYSNHSWTDYHRRKK